MIQYSLDIPYAQRGYFTLEKYLINLNLSEIEDKLGYEKGRLKQGADFYILQPPNHTSDFEIMGTSVLPGHKLEDSSLQRAINGEGKKKEALNTFRRKRLIKVVPLQIHLEAMRKYLSKEEYILIKDMNTNGRSRQEFIRMLEQRFKHHIALVTQIRDNFDKVDELFQNKHTNDKMYPSAKGWGVPQWKLNRPLPARCVCRLTDYQMDRYQALY